MSNGGLPKIVFWADEKAEMINPDLFSTVAEAWAKKIKEVGKIAKDKNKISQIRKFYDEVLLFSDRVKNEDQFKKMLPYLKMLNAKAAYADGRNHITKEFRDFIQDCVSLVNTKKDFDIFVKFFEAFMGFYRYYDELFDRRMRR
ncbi:type III-A CRISPR-associated protein Csm2 [Thermodesulfovibrio sp. Kuro-1]|jgi:CRISPR-associated protein Csm2|uniref:type III-A CRISPR-associated protein Csm2 n=1 Tax=Thermodesulfovibrio sp. Kuro-1 TaxID=2580394 RepID=UPI001143E901|nr:type III-A CRISPR-associated protein Csm2 [Thermodesulfovibrio sp. Kuro-1]